MAVSFNKLWKKLIDLGMSRSELRVKAGISTRQLAKLGKNENVTTDVLVRICRALNCDIGDIMSFLITAHLVLLRMTATLILLITILITESFVHIFLKDRKFPV
jgi:DNA-binding Xre family transcriptional regulator